MRAKTRAKFMILAFRHRKTYRYMTCYLPAQDRVPDSCLATKNAWVTALPEG